MMHTGSGLLENGARKIALRIDEHLPTLRRTGKSKLKALMSEDVREAIGHGVRAKCSKSGAVSFDVLETEVADGPVQ